MTDARLIVAHLVGLALSPVHQPDAWQRALARLRAAVEQDDTAPVHPENVAPEAAEALP